MFDQKLAPQASGIKLTGVVAVDALTDLHGCSSLSDGNQAEGLTGKRRAEQVTLRGSDNVT
ncbi:hypothetical protein GCM10007171_40900 [Dickeya fangzhongdai]|nr:hypothetical protein GCM10007171_40900 [Dickeya fangzhongdai]